MLPYLCFNCPFPSPPSHNWGHGVCGQTLELVVLFYPILPRITVVSGPGKFLDICTHGSQSEISKVRMINLADIFSFR